MYCIKNYRRNEWSNKMNRLQVLSEVQNKSEISCYDFDRLWSSLSELSAHVFKWRTFGGSWRMFFILRERSYIIMQFFSVSSPLSSLAPSKMLGQKDKSNHYVNLYETPIRSWITFCCISAVLPLIHCSPLTVAGHSVPPSNVRDSERPVGNFCSGKRKLKDCRTSRRRKTARTLPQCKTAGLDRSV